jgi:hypothetical protein
MLLFLANTILNYLKVFQRFLRMNVLGGGGGEAFEIIIYLWQ